MEQETQLVEAKLPKFLKVLCILTFIGAGLGLVGGLYNLMKAPYALEEYERSIEMMGGAPEGGFLGSMMEMAHEGAINALPLACGNIGANLFCLFGALMMWKMRKTGFYAYAVGQVIGIAIPAIFMTFGAMMIVGSIFPIAFIIMYALNLKHLK